MMRVRLLAIVVAAATGCVAPTQYFKEVIVTKDGNGKVQSIVITERVFQPEEVGAPFNPEYIKVQNYRLGIAVQQVAPTATSLPTGEQPKN